MADRFDFHLHTTCSDGLKPPRAAIDLAKAAALTGISITDHDTARAYQDPAVQEALSAGSPRILPGIEVSTSREGVELHILGYFPGGLPPGLAALVSRLLAERAARIRAGLRKLGERGVDIGWSEVQAEASGGVISRGHLAQILVRKHYVPNVYAAFPSLLGPEVVPPPGIDAHEVVGEIRRLGGIAVWAHPILEHVETFLDGLCAAGLSGVELHTPRRRAAERRGIAERTAGKGLLVSGGSDWHGQADETLGKFAMRPADVDGFLAAAGWK